MDDRRPGEESKHVIRTRDLRKDYVVPVRGTGLRAALTSLIRRRTRLVGAVRGISLDIGPGEIVGFLGPNGAGKTTTLKMLAGLLHPTSGDASVLGYTPAKRDSTYLSQISLVMGQRSQLQWDIPVADSFRLSKAIFQIPDREYDERVQEFVDLLDLKDLLQKPARNLSLGERMKCELASSLLHSPRVLFLDEPTIGLDLAMQRRIREFVRTYNKRTHASVILTSHYMADVEALCERVVLIDQGTIVFDGSLTDLTRGPASRRTIGVQLSEPAQRDPNQVKRYLQAVAPDGEATFVEPTWRVSVPNAAVVDVSSLILANLPVADLTIENEPVEIIVERLFSEAVGCDSIHQ